MFEMRIVKSGETVAPAARKGELIAGTERDQPSFGEYLHRTGRETASQANTGPVLLVIQDGEHEPNTCMRSTPASQAREPHAPDDLLHVPFRSPSDLHSIWPEAQISKRHAPVDIGDVENPSAMRKTDVDPETESDPYVAALPRPAAELDDANFDRGARGFEVAGFAGEQGRRDPRHDDVAAVTRKVHDEAPRAVSDGAPLWPRNEDVEQSGRSPPLVDPLYIQGAADSSDADRRWEKRPENTPSVAHARTVRQENTPDRSLFMSALPGLGTAAAAVGADRPSSPVGGSVLTPKVRSRVGDLPLTLPSWRLTDAKETALVTTESPQARSGILLRHPALPVQMPYFSPVPGVALQAFYGALNAHESGDMGPSSLPNESAEDGVPGSSVPLQSAQGAPSTNRMPAGQQLAPLIWAQMRGAIETSTAKSLQIQLQPIELGRVRVTMNTTDAGVQVIIFAERPETLELMRRFSADFERELRDLGYDSLDMNFSHQQSSDPPFHKRLRAEQPDKLPDAALPIAPGPGPTDISAWSGMDIRL